MEVGDQGGTGSLSSFNWGGGGHEGGGGGGAQGGTEHINYTL